MTTLIAGPRHVPAVRLHRRASSAAAPRDNACVVYEEQVSGEEWGRKRTACIETCYWVDSTRTLCSECGDG